MLHHHSQREGKMPERLAAALLCVTTLSKPIPMALLTGTLEPFQPLFTSRYQRYGVRFISAIIEPNVVIGTMSKLALTLFTYITM